MSRPTPLPIESLLEHRQWVRRLARSLVADESRVDDLEQATWLAALRRPALWKNPRAWLGRVVRNLAYKSYRETGRRTRRERASAREEALPSAGAYSLYS